MKLYKKKERFCFPTRSSIFIFDLENIEKEKKIRLKVFRDSDEIAQYEFEDKK